MIGLVLLSLVLLVATLWACLGLWYQLGGPAPVRIAAMAAWAVFGLAAIVLAWRHEWRGLLSYALAFALFLSWWMRIEPTGNRVWADDVAQELRARVDGNIVHLDNVRNFTWRSETDYTPRWESRSYDLDELQSVDVALSYWMGPAIAHTLVSFGFADGRYLTYSIEIRKQRGEAFSGVAGFFKHFEASLIAAEESDILRTRTNARGEDVYLYRVTMSPEARRSLFLAYATEANTLAAHPRFYNTLTANCTTIIFEMMRRIVPGLPLDWRLLASGYLPGYLYKLGALAPGQTLEALHQAGHINARALAAPDGAGFSRAIRAGTPGMENRPTGL